VTERPAVGERADHRTAAGRSRLVDDRSPANKSQHAWLVMGGTRCRMEDLVSMSMPCLWLSFWRSMGTRYHGEWQCGPERYTRRVTHRRGASSALCWSCPVSGA